MGIKETKAGNILKKFNESQPTAPTKVVGWLQYVAKVTRIIDKKSIAIFQEQWHQMEKDEQEFFIKWAATTRGPAKLMLDKEHLEYLRKICKMYSIPSYMGSAEFRF